MNKDTIPSADNLGRSPLRVLMTGSSGMIGTELSEHLHRAGHSVTPIIRTAPSDAGSVYWNPSRGVFPDSALSGASAVIHLAGANIAARRWTARVKEELIRSRVESTRLLAERMAESPSGPQTLICASGINIYRANGEVWGEEGQRGSGFLADLVGQWEAAAAPAIRAGRRVIFLRLPMVLSAHGGAMAKLLPLYRCGLGGPIGTGEQHLPWVSIADVRRVVFWCLSHPEISGALNVCAPHVITQKEFSQALSSHLGRPGWLPSPAWALKLALGEMATEMLLCDLAAKPERLLHTGFQFAHPELKDALRALIPHVQRL